MITVEEVCTKCPPRETDELRSDSSHLLRDDCPLQVKTLQAEEHRDIKELREDQPRVVLRGRQGDGQWW